MAAISNYAEKALLDWLMTAGAATRPTAWYVALFTAAPSDAGGGTELSGNGYARKAVTFAAASSPGGTTQNTNTVTFAAAGGDWGAISHIGIFDAVNAGNLLWHGALANTRTVFDGDDFEFDPGQIQLTMA